MSWQVLLKALVVSLTKHLRMFAFAEQIQRAG